MSIEREMIKFKQLNSNGQKIYVERLLRDYHTLEHTLKHTHTTSVRSASHKVKQASPPKKNVISTKMHSTIAAGIVSLLYQIPFQLYIGVAAMVAWSPFFGHEIFISFLTSIITWVVAECDYITRPFRK